MLIVLNLKGGATVHRTGVASIPPGGSTKLMNIS